MNTLDLDLNNVQSVKTMPCEAFYHYFKEWDGSLTIERENKIDGTYTYKRFRTLKAFLSFEVSSFQCAGRDFIKSSDSKQVYELKLSID